MIIRRTIYMLSLILIFFFYILYPPWLSWYLFLLMLLLPLFDLAISLPGMFSKSVSISAPLELEQNSIGHLTVKVINLKSFPIRCIGLKMQIIGDDFSSTSTFYCPADHENHTEIPIDTTKTGLTIFEVLKCSTVSLLGLFSIKLNIKTKIKVLIMPKAMKPDSSVVLPRGIALQPKPGGGFSEEHDMRQYRSGDSIRNVNWKVSAKYDDLIVREPLVPANHSKLVHVLKWKNSKERDLTLARLRYICKYMTDYDMSFFIKFADSESLDEIFDEAGLIDFLRNVLDPEETITGKYMNLPTRFAWEYKIDASEVHKNR